MAVATGARFAGGPATLPPANQTSGFTNASLPAGAKSIYASNNNDAYVALLPVGTGEIAYLGWDWFGAAPAPGAQDGGWLDVLDRAVEQVSHRGDFNADGAIDAQDFNIWNINKFMSSDVERGDRDGNELALVATNATSPSTPWNSNSINMSLRHSRGVRGVRSIRIA